jgi:hypothetical protein
MPDSVGLSLPLRFPGIARKGQRVVYAGMRFAFFDDPIHDSLLHVWDSANGALGRPTGRHAFVRPRIGLDSSDRIHILWAEPDTLRVGRIALALSRLRSVWWSTFDGRWSSPRQLLQTKLLLWDAGPAELEVVDNKSLEGVAIAANENGQTEVVHIQLAGDSIHATRIPGTGGALYVSMAVDGEGHRFVTYVTGSLGDSIDVNRIYMVSSSANRGTWSTPAIVRRSGATAIHEVTLLIEKSTGTLHLISEDVVGDSGNRVQMRHIESRNHGTTWSSAVGTARNSSELGDTKSVIDRCGVVHTVYQVLPPMDPHLVYLRFNGKWSTGERLFPNLQSLDPSLTVDPNGSVRLIFVGRAANSPEREQLRTYVSVKAASR